MNIDEAGELIKTAVDLDPDSGAIADSLGWFYFKKGRFEEALKELLRSEMLLEGEGEEADAVILDHIAQAYYSLGRKEKAIEYMERAAKLEPDKKEYSVRLSQYREASESKPAPEEATNSETN
jgi:tetratricopeptide (TPR) repeat protein